MTGRPAPWLAAALCVALAAGCNPYSASKKRKVFKPSAGNELQLATDEMVVGTLAGIAIDAPASENAATLVRLNELLGPELAAATVPAEAALQAWQAAGLADPAAVARRTFDDGDVALLQEALFLAPTVRRLSGRGDALDAGRRIAAWAARQVALAPEGELPPAAPLLAVVRGRGTPADRAGVFLALAQQSGLHAAVLGGLDAADDKAGALVAVFVGGEKPASAAFDLALGLPILGPDGQRPATVAEVVATPKLWQAPRGLKPAANVGPPRLLHGARPEAAAGRYLALQKRLREEDRLGAAFDPAEWLAAAQTLGAPGLQPPAPWAYLADARGRGAVARAATADAPGMYWRSQPQSPRRLAWAGKFAEASKAFSVADLAFDAERVLLELRGVSNATQLLQAKQLAPTVARIRQDLFYFAALAQLDKPDAAPAIARGGFERLRRQALEPGFVPDDVLDYTQLGMTLVDGSGQAAPHPGRGVYRALGPAAQASARFAAGIEDSAAQDVGKALKDFDAAIRDVAAKAAGPWEKLSHEERAEAKKSAAKALTNTLAQLPRAKRALALRTQLDAVRNEILEHEGGNGRSDRRDVLEAAARESAGEQAKMALRYARGRQDLAKALEDFARQPDPFAGPEFASFRAAPPAELKEALAPAAYAKLAGEARTAVHRQALRHILGDDRLGDPAWRRGWLGGALRGEALALTREGKRADAAALLKDLPADLPAVQRTELAALGKFLAEHPNASIE